MDIKQYDLTVTDVESIYGTDEIINIDYDIGEIHYSNGAYHLYEIPMYGGRPDLVMVDTNAAIIVSTVRDWT